jgi:hypothetical protein
VLDAVKSAESRVIEKLQEGDNDVCRKEKGERGKEIKCFHLVSFLFFVLLSADYFITFGESLWWLASTQSAQSGLSLSLSLFRVCSAGLLE